MIGVALDKTNTQQDGASVGLDVIDVVVFDFLQTDKRCGRVWFQDPSPEPDCSYPPKLKSNARSPDGQPLAFLLVVNFFEDDLDDRNRFFTALDTGIVATMGNRIKGRPKKSSIKAAISSKAGSKRKLSRMGKVRQKNKAGLDATFIGRSRCLTMLQINLKDFRRLCILKGIYPREPHRAPSKKKGQSYYHIKDIRSIAHEPVLEKVSLPFDHFTICSTNQSSCP
jgi:hypothetical protein